MSRQTKPAKNGPAKWKTTVWIGFFLALPLAAVGLSQDLRQRNLPFSGSSPVNWNLPLPNPQLPAQGYPVLEGIDHIEIYHAGSETRSSGGVHRKGRR